MNKRLCDAGRKIGVLLVFLEMTMRAGAIEFAFKDPQYSFQSVRALGYAVSGGAGTEGRVAAQGSLHGRGLQQVRS